MLKFKDYFCGNKISEYGLKNGFVDYRTLAKSFDAVLNNDIMSTLENQGFYFEIENGFVDNDEEIEALEDEISDLEALLDEMEDPEDSEEFEKLQEKRDLLEELENSNGGFPDEIFQYYIISDNGAKIIEEFTNDPVFYCSELDMYIWGVCHYGTSWDYVLTDIPCGVEE